MTTSRFTGLVRIAFAVLLLGACGLGLSLSAAGAGSDVAYAATNTQVGTMAAKNLKQQGVKFDLKKGKKVKFNVYHSALEAAAETKFTKVKQPFTANITSYKVKNAKKKGYKQATLTVKYSSSWKPSKATSTKVWLAGWGPGQLGNSALGSWYFTVLDYNTGISLVKKNPYSVKVKYSWTDHKGTKKHYILGSNTAWVRYAVSSTAKLTITYPKKYKGLCLGVGASTWTYGDDKNNGTRYMAAVKKFCNGKISSFASTALYKKGKANVHFMRIK